MLGGRGVFLISKLLFRVVSICTFLHILINLHKVIHSIPVIKHISITIFNCFTLAVIHTVTVILGNSHFNAADSIIAGPIRSYDNTHPLTLMTNGVHHRENRW